MEERYYCGLQLAKDLEFCAYMQELQDNPAVYIINEGKRVLVHEMEYKDDGWRVTGDRIDTGRTHIGYDLHYVTFLYGGSLFYMQAGTCYPFIDENEPGAFIYVPYRLTSPATKQQMDYYLAYSGISSLQLHSAGRPLRPRDAAQGICPGFRPESVRIVAEVVRDLGGCRENTIWADGKGCIMLPTETWNDEHKVVRMVSLHHDADGHRDTFEVDLVCRKICGR